MFELGVQWPFETPQDDVPCTACLFSTSRPNGSSIASVPSYLCISNLFAFGRTMVDGIFSTGFILEVPPQTRLRSHHAALNCKNSSTEVLGQHVRRRELSTLVNTGEHLIPCPTALFLNISISDTTLPEKVSRHGRIG